MNYPLTDDIRGIQKTTAWRNLHVYDTYQNDKMGNPILHIVATSDFYPSEDDAINALTNKIDMLLTNLNDHGKNINNWGEPMFDIHCQSDKYNTLVLRKKNRLHVFDMKAYFNAYPIEITRAVLDPNDPDKHIQYYYRGYWIFPNEQKNRFKIKFHDMQICIRHTLAAALEYIDRRQFCEKILTDGRQYYA